MAPALLNVAYEFGEALSGSELREATVGKVVVALVREHIAMRRRLDELDPRWHPYRLTLDELTDWRAFATSDDGHEPDAWPRYDPTPNPGSS
jgi:hypothetical protein